MNGPAQPRPVSAVIPSADMARRRGQQTGNLRIQGPSWIGYWWEEIRTTEGKLEWHRFCKKICDATQLDPTTRRLRKVTKNEAQRLFHELYLSKLDVHNTNPQSLATLAEFVTLKFEPPLVLKKRKTQEHLRNMLHNHILPEFGSKRLRELRLDDVQTLILQKVAAGCSPQTVHHVRNTLATVLRSAKQHGWLPGDLPTDGVQMPELVHRSRTALTSEQLQLLLAECDITMYTVVLADSLMGLRRGELAGLRWRRLNLTAEPAVVDGEVIPPMTVAIREQYVWVFGKHMAKEHRGGRYESLKTDNGLRNIPITPALVSAFVEMRKREKFVGPDDAVFVGRNGTPLDMHNYLARHFQPLLKRLGLPKIAWHDLRHTNATLSELAGATQTNRNKVLGHGGDRIGRHYTHKDMEQMRTALQSVEDAVLPRPKLRLVK